MNWSELLLIQDRDRLTIFTLEYTFLLAVAASKDVVGTIVVIVATTSAEVEPLRE